ncbi:MAG: ABC transporter ATP-binding protein [Mycoplasma sp.]
MNKIFQFTKLKTIASLILLLNTFGFVMVAAIMNGTIGFLTAMGVTIFGAVGIAKILGESIPLSYELIISLIIICGVLRGLLRCLEQYSNHFIAFKILAIFRNKIFYALRELSPAKVDNKQKGNIISMITADIETLEIFYAHTISPIAIAITISVIMFFSLGFLINWYMALVAIIGYIVIGIIIPLIGYKSISKSGKIYRKEFANFNSYILDSIKGVKEIIFNNETITRIEIINQKTDKLLKETKIQKNRSSTIFGITDSSVSLFIILGLVSGVLLVYFDGLSIGKMIIGVVMIFSSFGPVIALANLPANLTHTFASGKRILDLLAEKPMINRIDNNQNIKFENLEINNLDFGYNDELNVLNNINLKIKKGEILGIVGPSGIGKSTLLKLILRFYNVKNGNIKINGINIEQINTDSLLENVTLLSQNTYLFNLSIKENLLLAKPDATDQEIIEACKSASIHDFISELKDGYDTMINTFGDNLSTGQKQRIGLARVFLKGSTLILLDEPTSNVDILNEKLILKSIIEKKKDKAFIIISHRTSTVSIADNIYKFENHQLQEVKNNDWTTN